MNHHCVYSVEEGREYFCASFRSHNEALRYVLAEIDSDRASGFGPGTYAIREEEDDDRSEKDCMWED